MASTLDWLDDDDILDFGGTINTATLEGLDNTIQQQDVGIAAVEGLGGELWGMADDVPGLNLQAEREKGHQFMADEYGANVQGTLNALADKLGTNAAMGSRVTGVALGEASRDYAKGLAELETSLLEKRQEAFKTQVGIKQNVLQQAINYLGIDFMRPYYEAALAGGETSQYVTSEDLPGLQSMVRQYTDPNTGEVHEELFWTSVGNSVLTATGMPTDDVQSRDWANSLVDVLSEVDFTPGVYTLEDGTIVRYNGGYDAVLEMPNGAIYDMATMKLLQEATAQANATITVGAFHVTSYVSNDGSTMYARSGDQMFEFALDEVIEMPEQESVGVPIYSNGELVGWFGIGGAYDGWITDVDGNQIGSWDYM